MPRIPPFLPALLLWIMALQVIAADAVPYTGPFLKLPPLPVEPMGSTTAYEVQGDVGTMQDTPGPGATPYWLTAWVEKMPIPETDRLNAPSAIHYRRLSNGQTEAGGPPLFLTQTAASARVEVVRGTNGGWILVFARTEGLKAWWIPADPALPVPAPLTVWGIGGPAPFWTAAGDGTSVWVWVETPGVSGDGWFLSYQQRMAILQSPGGVPGIRHLAIANEYTFIRGTTAHLCAHDGLAVLTYPNYSDRSWISLWNNRGTRFNVVSLPGGAPLGILPWSDGEFLSLKATPLHPLKGAQIFGTRINRQGQAVPGTVPLLLANVEEASPVRPLRTGGVMSSSEGSIVFQPGANFPLSLTGTAVTTVTGVDGTPEHRSSIFSQSGEVYLHKYGAAFLHRFPLTTGNGFSTHPLLSWGQYGWPMLSWTQHSSGSHQNYRSAFHRRQQGWLTLPTSSASEATHASGKGFYNIFTKAGDIRGIHWRVNVPDNNTMTGTPIEVATAYAAEKLPVLWYDNNSSYFTGWVEQSTDPEGDPINKIRQRDIYVMPSSHKPAFTSYITGREITRLMVAGSGQLTWLEQAPDSSGGYLVSARAGSESSPLLVPQFITSGVSGLLGASERLIAVRRDDQTLIYSRYGSSWTQVPSALLEHDAVSAVAVAGNCLFWIAPGEDGASMRLYLQTFTGLHADPVQLVPTGPVLPDQLAAATDQQGRYAVAVRPMEPAAPVLTLYVLAPGAALDPGLRPSRETLEHLTLTWNPTELFPSSFARFQRSADLIHWEPVPAGDAVRSPQIGLTGPSGFRWELTQPGPESFFYRMEAQMVP